MGWGAACCSRLLCAAAERITPPSPLATPPLTRKARFLRCRASARRAGARRDAIEPVSDIEHAIAYFFELQVGTHSIFVEVEFSLYYLFIIVTPVPALQRLVETVLFHGGL